MSATPPGTPKAPSKWASRMGAAVRRSSTLLAIARPSTPQTDRDSDTTSLRKSISREAIAAPPRVNTSSPAPGASSQPPPPPQVMIPTPIAESPAREAEALREAAGPSLLSQGVVAAADDKPKPTEEYVPPPTIDSTAGNPGAFTDIIDTIPQPTVVKDPFAASNTGPPPPPPADSEPAAPESEPPVQLPETNTTTANPGAFTDDPEQLPQPTVARDVFSEPEPVAAAEPVVDDPAPPPASEPEPEPEHEHEPAPAPAPAEPEPEPETFPEPEPAPAPAPKFEAPALTPTISYFDDKPMAESMSGSPTEAVSPEFAAAVEAIVPVRSPTPEPEPASGHLGEAIAMPLAAVAVGAAVGAEIANDDQEPASEDVAPSMPVPDVGASRDVNGAAQNGTHGHGMFGAPYALGEYSSPDIWGGAEHAAQKPETENVWATATRGAEPGVEEAEEEERYSGYTTALPIAVPIPVRPGEPMAHSVESLPLMPNPHPVPVDEDPFADPREAAPVPQVMPHDSDHIVTMPLPSFNDVVVPQRPSSRSTIVMPSAEADERTPLIPSSQKSRARHHPHHPHIHSGPIASTSWPPHGSAAPQLTELGWLVYALPDASTYYAHPGRRTTTAADLRSPRVLAAVEAWLDARSDESRDVGVEAWLRVSVVPGTSRGGWGRTKRGEDEVRVERFWVDHHVRTVVRDADDARSVGFGRGHGRAHGSQKGKAVPGDQEDQLDLEFRYWSFMEAHPAHNPLPHSAKAEAMDVLTWAWTDRLLPSARPIPAPFAQEECQELMSLLRSFNDEDSRDDHGIQTRVVARVLLRVALWRQTYFRPHKPLPSDAGVALHSLSPPRRPFFRMLFDVAVSILCLGIPLLFIERARLAGTRADHESGFVRSNPLIVAGACTCLVAAVVLSSSVTFVSIPGLGNAARTAGMLAVVFAAFAIFATGAAVLRHHSHKTALRRPSGVEGLMAISRRTVALSLPAVFVAYALIAFIAGIVLYAFRGVPDTRGPERSFGDYMRWVIVGVVGALAGVVTMALVVFQE